MAVALPDSFHIYVKVSRPWKFRAGQFVYLTIPEIGRWGIAQSHPFMVSSWLNSLQNNLPKEYDDRKSPDTVVLIAIAREGLTKNLHAISDTRLLDEEGNMKLPPGDPRSVYASGNLKTMKAFINGPYSRELDFSQYSTVLLFATGISITTQLPYLKQLIADHCK